MRTQSDALHAALQTQDKLDDRMPWVSLIIKDIGILRESVNGKLDELPPPEVSLHGYWHLAKNCPKEWKTLAKLHFTIDDDHAHVPAAGPAAPFADVSSFVISVALLGKTTRTLLRTGRPSEHKIKCDVCAFIGDMSICRVCGTDFGTRARLVKYLLERRVRSKARGKSCQEAFLQLSPAPVPLDILRQLEMCDAERIKADRKDGHTNVIAKQPCKRTQASILSKSVASSELHPKRSRITSKRPAAAAFVQHVQATVP